jgi:hypothetical protein
MAKKSAEKSQGVGMIVTLVFFILASLIFAVLAYLFYEGEQKALAAADEAKKAKTTLDTKVAEEQARRDMLRIAMGVEDPQDRENLRGVARNNAAALLDEHKRVADKLGTNAFPTPNAFRWPLIDGTGGGQEAAPSPNKNLVVIVREWATLAKAAEAKARAEEQARKNAEAGKQAAEAKAAADKEAFDQAIAKLGADYKAKTDDLEKRFHDLMTVATQKAADFKKTADEWSERRAQLEDDKNKAEVRVKGLGEKLDQARNPSATDWSERFRGFDAAKFDDKKGEIVDKSGKFVTLRFTTKLNLLPGQSFVVIPPATSLAEVIERERALEKHHNTFLSLDRRELFSDNEMIKGMVEVVEVTGPYSARARIVSEPQEVRNPISKKDQVFNLALSTATKNEIAFAGIIDLDGDGLPDNEAFVRILEKNNAVVTEYLDLKTGEIRTKTGGMSVRTKFLIIGSDAPTAGKIKVMMDKAKELGVQIVDARRFLTFLGVPMPKHPARPFYGSVNIGETNFAAPKDPDAAPEPKKENGAEPKKDEGR